MNIYEGQDRVAVVPQLGRPMRQGAPEALKASDRDRVKELLEGGDRQQAGAYAGYYMFGHQMMITTAVEWILHGFDIATEKAGLEQARAMMGASLKVVWTLSAELAQVMHPATLSQTSTSEFLGKLATRQPTRAHALMGDAGGLGQEFLSLLGDESVDSGRLIEQWERYFAAVTEPHDSTLQLVWAFWTQVAETLGQETAQDGLRQSFTRCGFYDHAWREAEPLEPAALAVMLSEQLRGHFSGEGRSGQVTIEEDEDSFRVVMGPCGSGQVMRQAPRPGLGSFQEPGPMTWGRKGVPIYCSHCAINELESVKRLGRLAWVTEFDPDPERPCQWRVFKKAEEIPASYYQRLGLEKP